MQYAHSSLLKFQMKIILNSTLNLCKMHLFNSKDRNRSERKVDSGPWTVSTTRRYIRTFVDVRFVLTLGEKINKNKRSFSVVVKTSVADPDRQQRFLVHAVAVAKPFRGDRSTFREIRKSGKYKCHYLPSFYIKGSATLFLSYSKIA